MIFFPDVGHSSMSKLDRLVDILGYVIRESINFPLHG